MLRIISNDAERHYGKARRCEENPDFHEKTMKRGGLYEIHYNRTSLKEVSKQKKEKTMDFVGLLFSLLCIQWV
jgi:hypothetical protein